MVLQKDEAFIFPVSFFSSSSSNTANKGMHEVYPVAVTFQHILLLETPKLQSFWLRILAHCFLFTCFIQQVWDKLWPKLVSPANYFIIQWAALYNKVLISALGRKSCFQVCPFFRTFPQPQAIFLEFSIYPFLSSDYSFVPYLDLTDLIYFWQ